MLQPTLAVVCARLEDRGKEVGEVKKARAKARVASLALVQKVADASSGEVAAKVDVAVFLVRLA